MSGACSRRDAAVARGPGTRRVARSPRNRRNASTTARTLAAMVSSGNPISGMPAHSATDPSTEMPTCGSVS